ncbi:hypothetical protein ACVWW1_009250 [Bradyrhizobium sp. JR3.5]
MLALMVMVWPLLARLIKPPVGPARAKLTGLPPIVYDRELAVKVQESGSIRPAPMVTVADPVESKMADWVGRIGGAPGDVVDQLVGSW